ncbi:MAG: SRPBCC domain-containing protein [Bacteroidetes bacterium]|nr:SRPBCC domain-containing protein [Bacteroidota bacterium]
MESLKMSVTLPVKAAKLYKAWLTSKEHAAFTGGAAKVSSKVGGKFTAWDGYISGKNTELKANKKIVQTWRTSEFPEDAPDSILEIDFEEKNGKTKLNLYHYNLQKGDAKKYRDGWRDYYFEPMKQYFGE